MTAADLTPLLSCRCVIVISAEGDRPRLCPAHLAELLAARLQRRRPVVRLHLPGPRT